MVKLIGIILIVSSVIALLMGLFVDFNYGSDVEITGNVVTNIVSQPNIDTSLFDYLGGFIFSYSILSFIMGIMFLFRV